MQEYYEAIMAAAKACSDMPLTDQDMEAIVAKFTLHFTSVRKAWLKAKPPPAAEGVEGNVQPKKKAGGAPPASMRITWHALRKAFGTDTYQLIRNMQRRCLHHNSIISCILFRFLRADATALHADRIIVSSSHRIIH